MFGDDFGKFFVVRGEVNDLKIKNVLILDLWMLIMERFSLVFL